MIPSVSGTIKSNYVAFAGSVNAASVRNNEPQNAAVKTTAFVGGTTILAKGSNIVGKASKVFSSASKSLAELSDTTVERVEHVVDKNAVVKFFERIFGHSKFAAKVVAPVAGLTTGVLAIGTFITDAVNSVNIIPRLSVVRKIVNKN